MNYSIISPLRSSLGLQQPKQHKDFPATSKSLTPQQRTLPLRFKTRALLPDSILLAAVAPPSVKLSVLLKTGGVCIFAYWIANFVVPEIVLKDLQSKKGRNDNGEEEDEDDDEL